MKTGPVPPWVTARSVSLPTMKTLSWGRMVAALACGEASFKDLAAYSGLDERAVRDAVRALWVAGTVRVSNWAPDVRGHRTVPMFHLGQGPDVPRPRYTNAQKQKNARRRKKAAMLAAAKSEGGNMTNLERDALVRAMALERSQRATQEIQRQIETISNMAVELREAIRIPLTKDLMSVSFVEPGSGIRMMRGKWYLLSDSGSAYSPAGYDTPEAALEYTKSQAFIAEFGAEIEVMVPTYSETNAWPDMDECNVLAADDLLHFWLTTEPSLLLQLQ